ncbi:MAG: hypothetical protein LBU61_05380 [Coriobacteriales bacterium]|jgi:DNA-directed RNA polymerase subunit RPC12/RpoP|nr:hypothetical protein [Coriobacteriales bacterium]
MKCPYCDSVLDVADLKQYDEVLSGPPPNPRERVDWVMPSNQWSSDEQEGMFVYICSTCAGAIVSDDTLGSTSCPYCGNPVVLTDRFHGNLKPDLAIPFKLDRQAAIAALKKHYENKPYIPKRFKEDALINEIKGVYVPFWLFDSIVDADTVFDCTKVRHYSDSEYDYTETNYYTVRRSGTVEFAYVPVDGSFRLADDLMESIEPFDYSQLVEFQTAYLSGYSANIYDVDANTAIKRAQQRMHATTESVIQSTIQGYSTVRLDQMAVNHRNPRCQYAMLPVWLLSTSWDGNTYTYAMNGQTGVLVGNVPVDKSLRWKNFFITLSIAFAVIFVIVFIFGWLL